MEIDEIQHERILVWILSGWSKWLGLYPFYQFDTDASFSRVLFKSVIIHFILAILDLKRRPRRPENHIQTLSRALQGSFLFLG